MVKPDQMQAAAGGELGVLGIPVEGNGLVGPAIVVGDGLGHLDVKAADLATVIEIGVRAVVEVEAVLEGLAVPVDRLRAASGKRHEGGGGQDEGGALQEIASGEIGLRSFAQDY